LHSSSGRYGADRQLHLIAGRLDRDRYEPLVVLPDRGPLAEDLETAGVEVLIRPLSVIRRGQTNPAALLATTARDAITLSSLVRHRRIAVVHSNTSVILSGAAAAAVARVPHVWHVRESYERFARFWPAYRRVLSTARALPCVSRATAAQFEEGDHATVIHDGLAVDAHRAPRAEAREKLDLNPDLPVIAVLGRVSDWKGQDVLVRALAEPGLKERAAIGLIAGDPWPGAENRLDAVLKLASDLCVKDRVRLTGFRDDVDTIYGAADVIAVPSTAADPLPGAAIEAAAAGCAVVASDTGGLPEIIEDRETGRLIAPGDASALARAASELIDNPAERRRLGEAAARDARRRFSPERLSGAIHALYDELVR
jgi:glycosyltransferase involved in cell wall biosynthesis